VMGLRADFLEYTVSETFIVSGGPAQESVAMHGIPKESDGMTCCVDSLWKEERDECRTYVSHV